MTDIANLLFLSALALLFTHEIDAVKQHEWRLLPILRNMNDARGFFWFTLLHVPLFVLILGAMPSPAFRTGLCIFLIGHACAHWLLRKHHHYTFNNPLSNLLIYGATLCAISYLAIA